MAEQALALTTRRVVEESNRQALLAPRPRSSSWWVLPVTFWFRAEVSSRGTAGLVWESNEFSEDELESTRSWLRDRAVTIYGGTNEVQQNIIAKRVLGLPD